MYRYPVVSICFLLILSSFMAKRNRFLRWLTFDNHIVKAFQFMIVPMYLSHLLIIDQF